MKRLLGLLLLLVAFNVSAIEINDKLSGSWYNSDQDGHGLNVATLNEDLTLVYWYVYHTDGTPMFLITVGTNDGNRTSGTTYYHTGMKFGDFNPDDVQQTVWGTSTVTFTDCNTATLEYSSDDPAYGSGSIPMTRLTFVSGLKCSDSPLHGNYLGVWEELDEVGWGFTILFANGDMAFASGSLESAGVGFGEWWVTGSNSFSFKAEVYFVSGGSRNVTGSGKFNKDEVTANYSSFGKMTATPIQNFQYGLTTAKMAGDYIMYNWDELYVGTATIQNDGTLSGTTLQGCQVNGKFLVPDTNFNQAYFIDSSVSNCGDTLYGEGAAIYRYAIDEIVVMGKNSSRGYVWSLKRN